MRGLPAAVWKKPADLHKKDGWRRLQAGLLPAAIFVRSDITVYRKFIVFIHEVWYNTKEQGLTAPRSAEDKGKEKQIT